MKKNFKRRVLKNGLTVIFEKRNIPVVSMAFAVKSGGINESMKEKGISHFIEHMLYKGTNKRTSLEIAQEIEKNGGEINGFTSEEVTAFYCKLPSKHADIGLEVLSDIMNNSLFLEEEMEKEKKVIFEEIKMRKDNPQIYVIDKIQNMLYKKPFGSDLIGTYKNMNLINRKKILKRVNEVYVPENMVLSVVGNYDFEKLVKFCEKNFKKKKLKKRNYKIIRKNDSKVEKRAGIDQANLVLAFHTPLANDKKSFAAEILISLMAGGMSSRLFSEIREKRNLAYSVKGHTNISKDYSYSLIYVGTTKDNVKKVKDLILKEFENISKDLTEKELKEMKDQLIGNYQISMEDSQEQMVNLLISEIEGNASKFYDFEKNISKVELEEVKELASKVCGKNYSFFALIPK
jgi:predicted Zn-dependent peptidase